MSKKIIPIIFTLIVFLMPIFAKAADPACRAEKELFEQSEGKFSLNMMRTVNNMIVSTATSLFANTTGVNLEQAAGCEYVLQDYGLVYNTGLEPCGATDREVCEELLNNSSGGTDESSGTGSSLKNSVRGSLLGMAYAVEDINMEEPLAVNFAYFWDKTAEKLPVVGKTFAANNEYAYVSGYNLPLLNSVYNLWETVRDISLAIISIILLYTGIMIIMRKKVNPQLVVSVQYAIPKVILGLVLIIFSYPIGSAIVGISWGLYRGAFKIAVDAFYPGSSYAGSGIGPLFLSIIIGSLRYGVGLMATLLMIVALIATAILWIVVQLKAAIIYVKMVLGVVTAPFEMALGTIPGNEDKIGAWFKRMAKLGVTVFAMGLSVPLVLLLAYEFIKSYSYGTAETGGFGTLNRILIPLVVIIAGFSFSLGMEKTIAGFFGDDTKKRK